MFVNFNMPPPPHLQINPQEIKKVDEFRKSKKTAILTILFTDIVGYTKFTEAVGEEKSNQIRSLHDKLFTDIITRDDAGEIIKQIGDSFLAVFAEPSVAVERILEFQNEIKNKKEEFTVGNHSIQVRAGIHLGQVSLENKLQADIFGLQVNKTSRIMSLASAEQILVSREVKDNAIGWLKDKAVYSKSYGDIKLKGINESVSIIEIYTDEIKSKGAPTGSPYRRKRKLLYISIGMVFMLLLAGFLKIRSTDPLRIIYKIKRLTSENGLLITSPSREWYLDTTWVLSSRYSEEIVDSLEWMHQFINKRLKETVGRQYRIYSQNEVINYLENEGEIIGSSFWSSVTDFQKMKDFGWLNKISNNFIGTISYWVKMEPWNKEGKYLYKETALIPNTLFDLGASNKYRAKSIIELASVVSNLIIYRLELINDRVIRGIITDVNNNKININIGSTDNVEEDMKFFIYKHFKYVNIPILGNKRDKELAIKYYQYFYDKNKLNYGKDNWNEYLDGLLESIQQIKSGERKENYTSYLIPGYGLVVDINSHSSILDCQMVVENSHEALQPEPGDDVFLIRHMKNPEKLLMHVP